METTTMGCIGIIGYILGLYWIMENQMETTVIVFYIVYYSTYAKTVFWMCWLLLKLHGFSHSYSSLEAPGSNLDSRPQSTHHLMIARTQRRLRIAWSEP